MKKIEVFYYNEVYCRIESEKSILSEISDFFTFMIPDFHIKKKFNPQWFWFDGRIRLFKKQKKLLPYGLLKYLNNFCKERNIILYIDPIILSDRNNISKKEFELFINFLNLPFSLREYQKIAIKKSIENKRITLLSPTGSGKSAILFCYLKWFLEHENGQALIIVPTIGLVRQMSEDFKEYGYTDEIYQITAGVEKETDCRVIISTWQSLLPLIRQKMKNKRGKEYYKIIKDDILYFHKFKLLCIDEVHSLKNAQECESLISLSEKCIKANYRFGGTGTLHDEILNRFQIQAMFGPIHETSTTKELINKGYLSKIDINSIILNYPDHITNAVNKLDYHEQSKFTESSKNPRQYLILDIVKNLNKNTLILFNKREHGNFLYELLVKETNKEIFYVDGNVNGDDRNNYRKKMENNENIIGVVSYGTFSQGINIKNIFNIIFSSSYKSKIRVLQSIGRGLRKLENKKLILWDIVDNIKYLWRHYQKRLEYYQKEQFPYQEKTIDIVNWFKNSKFYEKN